MRALLCVFHCRVASLGDLCTHARCSIFVLYVPRRARDMGLNRGRGIPLAYGIIEAIRRHMMNEFMKMAIDEARSGIMAGHGGPFGAVIVRDGEIVGAGHNMVLAHNDPTAHGEVSAIRDAGQNLDTFDMTGCELYTTGEPCPMCLGAILWANIDTVYYGCTIKDNEIIGFRDDVFNSKLSIDRTELYEEGFLVELDRVPCLALFDQYNAMDTQNY